MTVPLMIFYGWRYLKYSTYERNMQDKSENPPTFITITKPLNIKIGQTFCEVLK